ncbi:MAG TPA: DEAD/DEAH box helicase [Candidatus Acidoferrales bacterium]|nr:DEAD/DEAH box helicase [Candidatus Acidoferrales bacterium]
MPPEISHETEFHPLVQRWFADRFGQPTAAQSRGWHAIARGQSALIAAPTGSGKTLAAFLWSIDRLVRRALAGRLEDKTSVVYVSPLKALGNDIEKNLREPLAQILRLAQEKNLFLPQIRVAVRSGDTPARERQLMTRRPPHILITTPESLYILLTAERSRRIVKDLDTVIVDEIHAVAGDKRGSHLALSLERLEALAGRPLQRIGLSATQKPIAEMARLLMGSARVRPDGSPACAIIDVGHRRDLALAIEVPETELGPIATHEIWSEVYARIADRARSHRTTLVFVNTRRLVERVAHQLTAALGEGKVGAHHGSMSKKSRFEIEQKLKSGELPAVVATASLELGIDIGHVDLVCHIGAPRAIATFLQRIGRAGHWLGAIPKGIIYPLTRDDLLQSAAAVRAARAGALDRIILPEKPLDVLAQQMVATVASHGTISRAAPAQPSLLDSASANAPSGIAVDELWRLVTRAYPYRNLTRAEFDQVLEMLAEGIAGLMGRRGALIHHDRVHGRLRPRRGARLAAITNGGAIPDTADYDVIELPAETFVGKVNEDFAVESLAGDIFLLGNRSWRIRRVSSGRVWVEDARGAPPTIPFWLGEAPARTRELSQAVSDLRQEVARRLRDGESAVGWLVEACAVDEFGARQIVAYVDQTRRALGAVPAVNSIVAERFFDEAGGMQLVIHSPLGGRINRAWGLALRKRFCVTFDSEIQAAATDDGIVLSLGERHSFPLAEIFSWLRRPTVEANLKQALLASPMFTNRWRWNATRALAVERFRAGKKVPMAIQRFRAEDLLAAVFPEQAGCQDNHPGPVTPPDHPLVHQTLLDCLHEAMDVNGLVETLGRIESGEISTFAVETTAPSPMAHEILNANPYAFLDDAPLEERRARAVALRRADPDLAGGLGVLDQSAIDQVRAQAWPDLRDADELHDLLLSVGLLPVADSEAWRGLAAELVATGRAGLARWKADGHEREAYVATERVPAVRALVPDAAIDPAPAAAGEAPAPEDAARKAVQGWMEIIGPTTAERLAERLGLSRGRVESALFSLETAGVVLRGRFEARQAGQDAVEWCERRLLARIHRLTLGRLRSEIEPVTPADFIRFLLRWQRLDEDTRRRGREGLLAVIGQLQGLELPAPAWEEFVFPARVCDYDPDDLENLCLSGLVAWGRIKGDFAENGELPLEPRKRRKARRPFTRVAPLAFLLRDHLEYFLEPVTRPWEEIGALSGPAQTVAHYLEERGASFLTDIARGTGLLKTQAEEALWELVARGLVTGDGIAGLRVLLKPQAKRLPRRRLRLIAGGRSAERLMPLGRWSLWRVQQSSAAGSEQATNFLARQLLSRYGVVFRELLLRESMKLSWRALVQVYRRWEAQGEIRGGRFVSGFVGEQYALPEAVEMLRAMRRAGQKGSTTIVCAADPLNMVGILTPGPRISPYSNQAIAYTDGVPVEIGPLGAVRSRLKQAQPSP